MAEEAKDDSAKPKKSKKMLVIVLAIVLLAGGGGAGWFFFMRGKHEQADDHASQEAKRKKELKARVFVNLEPFTVNLADEDDRFAQVAVVLEVDNNETSEEIKSLMPAVRSRILLLLSSKQAADLLSLEGKEKLAEQIAMSTAEAIGKAPKKSKKKRKKVEEEDDEEDADGEGGKAASKSNGFSGPITGVNFAQFIVQ